MSDIVERLRIRQPLLGKLCDEAADEIERLRAAEHNYQAAHDLQYGEIERLKAALQDEREQCATVALEQRCERGTPWDLACTTIANAIRARAALEPGQLPAQEAWGKRRPGE